MAVERAWGRTETHPLASPQVSPTVIRVAHVSPRSESVPYRPIFTGTVHVLVGLRANNKVAPSGRIVDLPRTAMGDNSRPPLKGFEGRGAPVRTPDYRCQSAMACTES